MNSETKYTLAFTVQVQEVNFPYFRFNTAHSHPNAILLLFSSEERQKTKESYQESLQNVATVRQQAAVSIFHSCFFFFICSIPLNGHPALSVTLFENTF